MQHGMFGGRLVGRAALLFVSSTLIAGGSVVSVQADPLWPGGPEVPGLSTPSIPLPDPGTTRPSDEQPLARANFSTPVLDPVDGETVGIAQPVIISFTAAIGDKKTAEKAIRVSTDPEVDGTYRWVGNNELRWKPAGFWPAGTRVKVQAGSAAAGFSIGEEWVATADDDTHTITVAVADTPVRTIPTSMGANENPTPNGVYTVGERFADMYLDSSTYGVPVNSPDGYRTYVEYATRLTNSGIFLHAAPWSVGQQGNTNVSRGGINVSTDDARWFFENAPKGAPVIVQNTVGGPVDPTDGLTDFTAP